MAARTNDVKGSKIMWPTQAAAETAFFWSNVLLIVGLVLSALATIVGFWMANVRDGYLRIKLAASDSRIAELNEEAEVEHLQRVKLEAKIAPRSLTQSQQNDLAEVLSQTAKQTGTLMVSPSTPEAEWFARVLGAPLKQGGWNISWLPSSIGATILQPTGVVISYTNLQPDPAAGKLAAETLANWLTAAGIDATAIPALFPPPNTIAIVITPK